MYRALRKAFLAYLSSCFRAFSKGGLERVNRKEKAEQAGERVAQRVVLARVCGERKASGARLVGKVWERGVRRAV